MIYLVVGHYQPRSQRNSCHNLVTSRQHLEQLPVVCPLLPLHEGEAQGNHTLAIPPLYHIQLKIALIRYL